VYVNFSRFLAGLAVVGVLFGVVFGVGVATGRAQRPAAVVATAPTTPGGATGGASSTSATTGAAPAGAPGAGAGGAAAFGVGGGGGAPLTGSVESVSATAMAVKTSTGETVNVTLNGQTAVRRIEAGTVQDVKQGDQVIVTRDAASVATAVQVVPPGTPLGVGGGAGPRGGATATGTPAAGATPSGTPQRRGQ